MHNEHKKHAAYVVYLTNLTHSTNPLAPNDVYIRRIVQLTSRHCILNIYSTNTLTEYFKTCCTFSVFFFSSRWRLFHNATFLGSCNIHILYTWCAKILKKIPTPEGWNMWDVMGKDQHSNTDKASQPPQCWSLTNAQNIKIFCVPS